MDSDAGTFRYRSTFSHNRMALMAHGGGDRSMLRSFALGSIINASAVGGDKFDLCRFPTRQASQKGAKRPRLSSRHASLVPHAQQRHRCAALAPECDTAEPFALVDQHRKHWRWRRQERRQNIRSLCTAASSHSVDQELVQWSAKLRTRMIILRVASCTRHNSLRSDSTVKVDPRSS